MSSGHVGSHTSNSSAFETQQPSAETHRNGNLFIPMQRFSIPLIMSPAGSISTGYHQSETDQSYNIELSGYQSHSNSTSGDIYFQTGHAVIQGVSGFILN